MFNENVVDVLDYDEKSVITDSYTRPIYDKRTETTTDVWLTPPAIIKSLGEFDLDPASPLNRPWDTARSHFTILDNGLSCKWHGRVWLNPPYGKQISLWLNKLANHENGIALIFCRTETKFFEQCIWEKADAVFFFKGRLKFFRPNGEPGGSAAAPSCLVAYGQNNVNAIQTSGLKGKLVTLPKTSCRIVNR